MSVASWEEADLTLPSDSAPAPCAATGGGSSSPSMAASSEVHGRPVPVPIVPPQADEEEEVASSKLTSTPKSPSREAWGGPNSGSGWKSSGRGFGSSHAPKAASGKSDEVLDRLYHFKSKASEAERSQAVAQGATRLGELRHLDTLPGPALTHAPPGSESSSALPQPSTPHPHLPKKPDGEPPAFVSLPPAMVAPPAAAAHDAPAAPADAAAATGAADATAPPPLAAKMAAAGHLPPIPPWDAVAVASASANVAALGVLDEDVVSETVDGVVERLLSDLEASEASSLYELTMDDFELLRLVGKGGYGKVFQVRCTLNSLVYAMKVVDKASIEKYRSMDNIATELTILRRHAEQRHPFILGLECAFQSSSKLHFVMEYVPGGMLFAHLRSHEMFSEKMARFYAAEVMLGLQHLHGLSIIYRDLKPENVLICANGNCKLCDFGLAAIGLTASATHTSSSGRPVLVGTTEYMAPEVLRRMQCGQAVDVWALGVLLYEMMTGEAPWWHKEQKELQRKIVHTKLRLPTWFTNEAKSLVRGLLTKDPAQRLGVTPGCTAYTSDFASLQKHAFFRGLNFRMLLMCKLEAPFMPTLSADNPLLDTSNFDSKYTLEAPVLSPLRRPLSADMEMQFEALTLAYMSPETRDSLRHSLRDSLRDSARQSSRMSCESDRSSRASDGQGDLLRFGPSPNSKVQGAVAPGSSGKRPPLPPGNMGLFSG